MASVTLQRLVVPTHLCVLSTRVCEELTDTIGGIQETMPLFGIERNWHGRHSTHSYSAQYPHSAAKATGQRLGDQFGLRGGGRGYRRQSQLVERGVNTYAPCRYAVQQPSVMLAVGHGSSAPFRTTVCINAARSPGSDGIARTGRPGRAASCH
jgi:hypothetical protein